MKGQDWKGDRLERTGGKESEHSSGAGVSNVQPMEPFHPAHGAPREDWNLREELKGKGLMPDSKQWSPNGHMLATGGCVKLSCHWCCQIQMCPRRLLAVQIQATGTGEFDIPTPEP